MAMKGKLEDTPLQEVLQVSAYSARSGVLNVNGPTTSGSVLFQEGNVVCAYTASTRSLLERAGEETDARNCLGLRRIQALAALVEMFDLREGFYYFTPSSEPVREIEGIDMRLFYERGALDTGDLLLAFERAMASEQPPPVPVKREEASTSYQRRHPRFGPVMMKAKLANAESSFEGFLTTVSVGGALFQTEDLPQIDTFYELQFTLPRDLGPCQAYAKVVWANVHVSSTKRGVGLQFERMPIESLQRLKLYLEEFQQLASDMDIDE